MVKNHQKMIICCKNDTRFRGLLKFYLTQWGGAWRTMPNRITEAFNYLCSQLFTSYTKEKIS